MLKIRLARVGKKNYATFRIIVSDHTKSPKAEALEILGSFDPNTDPATLKIKEDRIKYWLSKGVGYSETISDILVKKGLIKKVERIEYTSKHPKKSKEQLEKAKAEAAEAAKKAKAAPPAAKAAEKPAEPKKEAKPATKPTEPKKETKPAEPAKAVKEEKKETPKPAPKK